MNKSINLNVAFFFANQNVQLDTNHVKIKKALSAPTMAPVVNYYAKRSSAC